MLSHIRLRTTEDGNSQKIVSGTSGGMMLSTRESFVMTGGQEKHGFEAEANTTALPHLQQIISLFHFSYGTVGPSA